MALQASGPIKWSQITAEFGDPRVGSHSSLGHYRMDNALEFGGMLLPLDTNAGPAVDKDIPVGNNPISFSDFYNGRLNIAIDYFSSDENRPDSAKVKYDTNDPNKVKAVGNFISAPNSTTGKKVVIAVNKKIGGKLVGVDGSTVNECSLRTGSSWDNDTQLRVDVGSSGKIIGGGGDGGAGGDCDINNGPDGGGTKNDVPRDGQPGENGTSALGIEHEGTVVQVRENGRIICGFGGGGGGGGAFEDSTLGEDSYKPRCSGGGGGGGGAGLPAGLGGRGGISTTYDPNECKADGDAGTAGAEPIGGEQGGLGGDGNPTPTDPNGVEALGGTGGRGRDQETTGTGFNNDGTGQNGLGNGSGNWYGKVGGAKGIDAAAIRRTSTSINWTFDTNKHSDGTVIGEGSGGDSESPTGVS